LPPVPPKGPILVSLNPEGMVGALSGFGKAWTLEMRLRAVVNIRDVDTENILFSRIFKKK